MDRVPLGALVRRFPKGPVLGITPFNFPLNLVAHKVAPAVAVGAPVVVKPAPATPLSALLLGELLAEADLPDGMFSVLPLPNERAAELVADPRLPVVSFTGSGPVGAAIRSAVPPKHVTLELGGNAAAVVCGDYRDPADLDHAAQRIALFGNYQAGQSCIAVQRVIVHRDVHDDLLPRLVAAVQGLRVGDPALPDTQVGPLISEAAAARVDSWVADAVAAGAVVVTGGVRQGSTYAPTVVTNVPADAKISCEEVFGPVLVVSVVDSDDDAFAAVNDSVYGLQAGVFSHDLTAGVDRRDAVARACPRRRSKFRYCRRRDIDALIRLAPRSAGIISGPGLGGASMSLEYDLEPTLADIRTLAKERYGLYLGALGLKFDENGVIVSDPENLVVVEPPPDVEREREKWRTFLNEVTELVTRFRSFYCLDPLDFTLMVGKLGGIRREGVITEPLFAASVYDRLNYADDHWVSRVDGMINEGQWTGPAAHDFHENFLLDFHTAVEQQRAYARELAYAGQTYHDTATDAVEKVKLIADACKARLSGASGGSISLLSAVGIVSGVLGFVPGPVGMGANVVGLGSGLLSAMIEGVKSGDETSREVTVDGGNAPQIIESTWEALDALECEIAEVDDTLWSGLTRALGSSQGYASPGLELPRPDLADGQGTLEELNIADPPGVPLAESQVVASVVDIYRAGYVNLPGAAEQFGQAATILDSCTMSVSVNRFFPRSIPKFDEARDNLGGILRRTSTSLADSGAALVETALGYGDTDEEGAEAMRQIGEIDPPPPAVPDTHPRRPPL